MQLCSAEVISADFFQFVENAFYFATIHKPEVTHNIPPLQIHDPPIQTYDEWKKSNPPVDTDPESPTGDTTQPIAMVCVIFESKNHTRY